MALTLKQGCMFVAVMLATSQVGWAQPPEGMENEGDASFHHSETLRGPQYDRSTYPQSNEDPNKFAQDIELEPNGGVIEPKASVNFVTGGIGDEERTAIEASKADYNTHITSARADGAFVDDAIVVIRDKAGEVVLDLAMGPILYVQLPVGSYTLEATSGDEKKTQRIVIGSAKKTSVIRLTFKASDE